MQNRNGDNIDVIHTHSHLEHTLTQDADLHTRRQILAEADHQADLAHSLDPLLAPPLTESVTRSIPHTDRWRKT